jgi:hypothetical protein
MALLLILVIKLPPKRKRTYWFLERRIEGILYIEHGLAAYRFLWMKMKFIGKWRNIPHL